MIQLLAVGDGVGLELLDGLAASLARLFRESCHVREEMLDVRETFEPRRNQYYSTAILGKLTALEVPVGSRLLAVTQGDLYVPVLTFVFGEGQLAGPYSLVSTHRLRDEYYGLPADPVRLEERLLKEAAHEIGHTFGLRHCRDWRCLMSSSHGVERIDVKGAEFCSSCALQIESKR